MEVKMHEYYYVTVPSSVYAHDFLISVLIDFVAFITNYYMIRVLSLSWRGRKSYSMGWAFP